MPLLNTDTVKELLVNYLIESNLEPEVFTEFPADEDNISEGVYIARFYQSDREALETTIIGPGSVYKIIDKLEIYLIFGQQNPYLDEYLNVLAVMIDDEVFKEYSPREYVVDQVFQNNSERYRITYSLTRHQLT